MARISSFARARRRRIRNEEETWLFAAAFVAILLAGLAAFALTDNSSVGADGLGLLAGCAAALCALAPPPVHRFLWHALANRVAVEPPRPIQAPWVIDGDTIDDGRTGIRYRLANIDAPETGDNAKCFLERQRGEAAKRFAIQRVRSAKLVQVRRTWRHDKYGRRVAFVLVDGADLGEALVAAGLARPWRGSRRRWCGKNGGLAKIARAGLMGHRCGTCSGWRED